MEYALSVACIDSSLEKWSTKELSLSTSDSEISNVIEVNVFGEHVEK